MGDAPTSGDRGDVGFRGSPHRAEIELISAELRGDDPRAHDRIVTARERAANSGDDLSRLQPCGGRSTDERTPAGAVVRSKSRGSSPTNGEGAIVVSDASAKSGAFENTISVEVRPWFNMSSGDDGAQLSSPTSIDVVGSSRFGAGPKVVAARTSQRGAAACALGAISQMTVASAATRRRRVRLTCRSLNPSPALVQALERIADDFVISCGSRA